jgi:hypothetical protein
MRAITLTLLGSLLLAICGAAPPAEEPPPAVAALIETTFVGQVELAPDADGDAVLVSTATEEVIVRPERVADALRAAAGRQVRLHGWIVDRPQDDLVMIVSDYEVTGAAL